jgi:hypothetical protein
VAIYLRFVSAFILSMMGSVALSTQPVFTPKAPMFVVRENPICGFSKWVDVETHPCSSAGNFVGKFGCAAGPQAVSVIYTRPEWKSCTHFLNGLTDDWPGTQSLSAPQQLVVESLNLLLRKASVTVLNPLPSESSIPQARSREVFVYAKPKNPLVSAPSTWSADALASNAAMPPYVPDIAVERCEHFHQFPDAFVLHDWSGEWLGLDKIFGTEWRDCTRAENEAIVSGLPQTPRFRLFQSIQRCLEGAIVDTSKVGFERLSSVKELLVKSTDNSLGVNQLLDLFAQCSGG